MRGGKGAGSAPAPGCIGIKGRGKHRSWPGGDCLRSSTGPEQGKVNPLDGRRDEVAGKAPGHRSENPGEVGEGSHHQLRSHRLHPFGIISDRTEKGIGFIGHDVDQIRLCSPGLPEAVKKRNPVKHLPAGQEEGGDENGQNRCTAA